MCVAVMSNYTYVILFAQLISFMCRKGCIYYSDAIIIAVFLRLNKSVGVNFVVIRNLENLIQVRYDLITLSLLRLLGREA